MLEIVYRRFVTAVGPVLRWSPKHRDF